MKNRTTNLLALITLLMMSTSAATKPPNILWIITDDHRSDSLNCYNKATNGRANSELGYVESPNIDDLAAEGVLFTQAYCNAPACAPSRSSMHTGKYPHRNGMYGFRKAHQAADCSSRMVPEVMKENGYQPSHFGKSGYYIFSYEGYNSWTDPGYYQPFVTRKELQQSDGSDFWFNSPWGEVDGKGMVVGNEEVYRFPDGRVKRFWRDRADREISAEEKAVRKEVEDELDILRSYTRQNPDLILGGVSPNSIWITLDGATVRSMQDYLANAGKDYPLVTGETAKGPDPEKPLFIHLGFSLPHTPVLPSKEFRDRFAGRTYRVPEFDIEKEAALMPPSLRDLRNDMDFSRMTAEDKQQAIRDYYAFCAMGDFLVGKAVESFKAYCEKHGQAYLILFVCGDHGWHLGEQGIEAKFGPWFQSTHGSVIVVSSDKKKFPVGTVCKELVEYVDFAPTFYEVAGVDAASHPGLDGISLSTTLEDGPQREYIIGEMNQVRGDRAYLRYADFAFAMRVRPYWTKPGEGYRPGDRIRWGLDAPAAEVDMSLYDLRIDPGEHVNVAYQDSYSNLAAFFRNKLASIVLGDGRVECDWTQKNDYMVSDFAAGAHDRKLNIPPDIIPPF